MVGIAPVVNARLIMVLKVKAEQMVSLIVVLVSVFLEGIFVMDLLNSVMLVGVLTAPMAQMKV
jgi:hypothetical protein